MSVEATAHQMDSAERIRIGLAAGGQHHTGFVVAAVEEEVHRRDLEVAPRKWGVAAVVAAALHIVAVEAVAVEAGHHTDLAVAEVLVPHTVVDRTRSALHTNLVAVAEQLVLEQDP